MPKALLEKRVLWNKWNWKRARALTVIFSAILSRCETDLAALGTSYERNTSRNQAEVHGSEWNGKERNKMRTDGSKEDLAWARWSDKSGMDEWKERKYSQKRVGRMTSYLGLLAEWTSMLLEFLKQKPQSVGRTLSEGEPGTRFKFCFWYHSICHFRSILW